MFRSECTAAGPFIVCKAMSQAEDMRYEDSQKIIQLNVGGRLYATSRTTLTRFADTMLEKMVEGKLPTETDRDGNVFIDRDGDLFRFVLNFLRAGPDSTLILPEDFKELRQLLAEADFYQIPELVEAVNKCMAEKVKYYEYAELENKGGHFTLLISRLAFTQIPLLKELAKCDLDASTKGRVTRLSDTRARIVHSNGGSIIATETMRVDGLPGRICDLQWVRRGDKVRISETSLNESRKEVEVCPSDSVISLEMKNMTESERILLFNEMSRIDFQMISSGCSQDSRIDYQLWTFMRTAHID